MQSNLDQLTDFIAQRAGISQMQARVAVRAVLDYLTGRLRSPVVGQIRALLDDENHKVEMESKS